MLSSMLVRELRNPSAWKDPVALEIVEFLAEGWVSQAIYTMKTFDKPAEEAFT